jgi:hypothetical protein
VQRWTHSARLSLGIVELRTVLVVRFSRPATTTLDHPRRLARSLPVVPVIDRSPSLCSRRTLETFLDLLPSIPFPMAVSNPLLAVGYGLFQGQRGLNRRLPPRATLSSPDRLNSIQYRFMATNHSTDDSVPKCGKALNWSERGRLQTRA